MKVEHEIVSDKNRAGIRYEFYTLSEKYEPLHWHEEMEILYYLNGEADILIDGVKYQLPKKQAVVINSGQVHNTSYGRGDAMYLCIHIDLALMEEYVPDVRMHWIECHPEQVSVEDFPKYRRLCELFEQLTKLYVQEGETFRLEGTGVIFQIFAGLLRDFSNKAPGKPVGRDVLSRERIQKVLAFAQEHYMEQVALEDVAGLLGLGREYFCRFFKRNMGMTFGRYLNEVRISKIHRDLLYTDEPVGLLMEKHGFLNEKVFYEMFRSIYGCRPLQVRNGPA